MSEDPESDLCALFLAYTCGMRRALFLTTLFTVPLLLSSCGKKPIEIPVGVQTVRAQVETVPFSRKRRGTHQLLRDGQIFAFAESTTVPLHDVVGKEADLVGIFERNTDPTDFPVLVVQEIRGQTVSKLKPWAIPSLSLNLQLPLGWKGDIKAGTAEFSTSGSLLLRITERTAAQTSSSGTESETFLVGLRTAHAELDTVASRWIVRVTGEKSKPDTIFAFTVNPVAPLDQQMQLFRRVLATVRFGTVSSSAPKSSSGSPSSVAGSAGVLPGTPCGGPAGILCPAGFSCVITEAGSDSGTCKKR